MYVNVIKQCAPLYIRFTLYNCFYFFNLKRENHYRPSSIRMITHSTITWITGNIGQILRWVVLNLLDKSFHFNMSKHSLRNSNTCYDFEFLQMLRPVYLLTLSIILMTKTYWLSTFTLHYILYFCTIEIYFFIRLFYYCRREFAEVNSTPFIVLLFQSRL